MSLNDLYGLALALLVVAVLAVAGSYAYLTEHDRRAVATSSKRAAAAAVFHAWNSLVNVLLTCWVLVSWRRVTRNLGLAYTDKHAIKRVRRIDDKGVITEKERPKVTYPWLLPRPDAYGVVLTVWTRVGVGRREWEDVAEHLANTWRCRRVHVHQTKPGRVTIRGLRRDPLAARLSLPIDITEAAVKGLLSRGRARSRSTAPARRVWIGRDEWATNRYLDMAGVPGLTCGGLQGYGKTSLALTVLTQLAPHVEQQLVLIDGKDGGDYDDWTHRAWLSTGDDLQTATEHLGRAHELMRTRLAGIRDALGTTNFWDVGPSASWPLVFVLVDECHTFLTEPRSSMPKWEQEAYRACRHYCEQLVKKGRSVGFATLLMTQKQTGDSIPTFIRDVCEVGVSFACRTREAAIASLGEGIRDYPTACPTALQQRPAYIGVAVAALPGLPGFVRLRVPYVDPDQAGRLARQTAQLRRDLDHTDPGGAASAPHLASV